MVRDAEIVARRARSGEHCRIITDSLAAMQRLSSDIPGPGQRVSRKGMGISQALSAARVGVQLMWGLAMSESMEASSQTHVRGTRR